MRCLAKPLPGKVGWRLAIYRLTTNIDAHLHDALAVRLSRGDNKGAVLSLRQATGRHVTEYKTVTSYLYSRKLK